ncbi:MAG: two-partner secretion domain-containing protein, partial [Gammaproteobacteria bacterium]
MFLLRMFYYLKRHYGYVARSIAMVVLSFSITFTVFANPVLDNIAHGNVSIQQTPNTIVVNQTSQNAILNWRSFNVGANESTHFQQPNGGIALNRISPTQGASQIYGRLTSTGQIILVNPAGIYFGTGAYVNVGSLIATTHNITDQNF